MRYNSPFIIVDELFLNNKLKVFKTNDDVFEVLVINFGAPFLKIFRTRSDQTKQSVQLKAAHISDPRIIINEIEFTYHHEIDFSAIGIEESFEIVKIKLHLNSSSTSIALEKLSAFFENICSQVTPIISAPKVDAIKSICSQVTPIISAPKVDAIKSIRERKPKAKKPLSAQKSRKSFKPKKDISGNYEDVISSYLLSSPTLPQTSDFTLNDEQRECWLNDDLIMHGIE